MNPRLTPTQIDEIFEAAEHVDVPVAQLLDAAAEIRATLLGVSGEISLIAEATPSIDDRPTPRVDPLRRTRRVRTALVAAALACATLLSAAVAGALPEQLQHPIAEIAKLVGIELPKADAAPTVASSGVKVAVNSPPTTAAKPATDAEVADTTDQPDQTETTAATTDDTPAADGTGQGPVDAQGNAYAYGYGKDPGVPASPNAPGQASGNLGNAYGQDPGVPGNGNAYGIGNGNGPPEDPGNGIGNAFGRDR